MVTVKDTLAILHAREDELDTLFEFVLYTLLPECLTVTTAMPPAPFGEWKKTIDEQDYLPALETYQAAKNTWALLRRELYALEGAKSVNRKAVEEKTAAVEEAHEALSPLLEDFMRARRAEQLIRSAPRTEKECDDRSLIWLTGEILRVEQYGGPPALSRLQTEFPAWFSQADYVLV